MVWWQEGQCALALHVSLQRCSAQMAPVCSAGLIRTLASSQIAWIQDLIHVSSVIIALISEVSVSVPKDIRPPLLYVFVHLISEKLTVAIIVIAFDMTENPWHLFAVWF